MTEIKIKRLSLENFKCHKSLTLSFEGGNASIYGDNATGKTSVYDALTWLLFGKDSAGNGEKNIEIKPLDDQGEVRDHLAVTAVEAELLVNGELVTLRRTYREIWSTKRGRSEATYDGNTSEYYVDGVPCKKNAFQSRVGELVSEETFRMLTSVSYFANGISWQERRAVLFDVAGVMGDAEILGSDPKFLPLVEGMGKLSLEDYKKKLLAEKKGFVGAKTEIPARISECQKTIQDIQGMDFVGAKAQAEELRIRQEQISAEIIAIEHDSAADKKRLEIRAAQLDLDKLESENKAYRASQVTGGMVIGDLKRDLAYLNSRLSNRELLLSGAEKSVGDYDRQIEDSRKRWIRVNSQVFNGGNCPTCGQKLPGDQLSRAMARFEDQKVNQLREIESTASALKESREQAENRILEIREDIVVMKDQIRKKEQDIVAAEAVDVEPMDMDGYQEQAEAFRQRINALNNELYEILKKSANVKERLRVELGEVNEKRNQLMGVISKESLLEYTRKRVDELREDAKNAAAALDAIEQMLFLMDEYSRYKTQFVEESINGMFRIARFRLFREQANGGVEDRCDVVLDGVPYININNGSRINVGIDIINTLSRAYGVRVPLFVDNAEGVTRLEESASQIIRLVVSEMDKDLRVQYENQR